LCPFSLLSYEVSGAESLEGPALGVGVLTRFASPSSLSPLDAPAPPRLRVRPDDIVYSMRDVYIGLKILRRKRYQGQPDEHA